MTDTSRRRVPTIRLPRWRESPTRANHSCVSDAHLIFNQLFIKTNRIMSQKYKIIDQQGLYFLTLSIVGWVDVFTRQEYREILFDSLDFCRKNKGLHLNAYVIMTSHLHLIVSCDQPHKLSEVIRDFKKFTARRILEIIEKANWESRKNWMLLVFRHHARSHANREEYMFWQEGNHPIEIWTAAVFDQKVEYIHNNPVKEGWVLHPGDYVYSSASNYLTGSGVFDVEVLE